MPANLLNDVGSLFHFDQDFFHNYFRSWIFFFFLICLKALQSSQNTICHCTDFIISLFVSFNRKSIGSVTFEKAQSESIRRSGYSAVGTAANIEFPGMFTNVIEEDER